MATSFCPTLVTTRQYLPCRTSGRKTPHPGEALIAQLPQKQQNLLVLQPLWPVSTPIWRGATPLLPLVAAAVLQGYFRRGRSSLNSFKHVFGRRVLSRVIAKRVARQSDRFRDGIDGDLAPPLSTIVSHATPGDLFQYVGHQDLVPRNVGLPWQTSGSEMMYRPMIRFANLARLPSTVTLPVGIIATIADLAVGGPDLISSPTSRLGNADTGACRLLLAPTPC